MMKNNFVLTNRKPTGGQNEKVDCESKSLITPQQRWNKTLEDRQQQKKNQWQRTMKLTEDHSEWSYPTADGDLWP